MLAFIIQSPREAFILTSVVVIVVVIIAIVDQLNDSSVLAFFVIIIVVDSVQALHPRHAGGRGVEQVGRQLPIVVFSHHSTRRTNLHR